MRLDIDHERLGLWQAFLQAHAVLVESVDADLERDHSLPYGTFEVLLRLSFAGGKLRMQDLARAALLSKSGITRLVDRMEATGLVERASCSDDRRGTWAHITDRGKQVLRKAGPTAARSIEDHFSRHVTDAEARVLWAVLLKLLEARGVTLSPGCASAREACAQTNARAARR